MKRAAPGRVGTTVRWTLAAAGFNAIAGAISARILAPSDRGLLAVILTLAGLVTVFASLGSNVVVRSELYRSPPGLLVTFIRLTALLSILVLLPALILTALLSSHLVDRSMRDLPELGVLLTYGLALFWWFQLQEALAAVGEIAYVARSSAAGSLTLALALLPLGALGGAGLVSVAGAYALSMAVQVTALLWRARRHLVRPEQSMLSMFLRQGPKTLGYHFGQNLVYRMDRYLLSVLSGTYEAGIYSVAATPAELLRMPVTAAGQFTMLDVARGEITYTEVLRRARRAVLFVASAGCVGILVAPIAIPLVYGDEYGKSVGAFQVLVVAQVLLAPYMIFARALAATPSRLASSAVGCSGLVVLAAVTLLMADKKGALGVAFAAAAAYLTMTVLSAVFCRRALERVPATETREA